MSDSSRAAEMAATRPEKIGLIALGVFTLIAFLGYSIFAVRPQNLALVPFAVGFFSISFNFFAQLHILVSFLALATILITRLGGRWVVPLLVVAVVSFVAEHMGTGYGIPFGGYEYTALLGFRIGPRVPALIPLSWFLMAFPSWLIAHHALGGRRLGRILLGAFALVLWDLALDPAMSSLTSYWLWHESGPYYGMPWLNLVGWFVTGLALMVALEFFARSGAFEKVPVHLMIVYWALVLAMPLGMLVGAGSWLGVVTTVGAIGVTGLVVLSVRSTLDRSSGAGLDSAAVPTPAGAP